MKKMIIFTIFILLSLNIFHNQVRALDVNATNGSAAAIQVAVDQVAAAGGGTVYIREGDFLFNPTEDGAVKIPGGVNLVGAGKDKTILRNIEPVPYADWSWGYFISVDGSQQNGKSVRLSGFTIIGFRELYPDHDARTKGIYIRQVKDFVVSDVKIKDTGGGGITVNGWRSYGDVPTQGVITHCDLINTNGLPMGPGAIAYGPNVLGYGVAVDGFGRPEAWIDDINQVLGRYDYGQPVVYIEDCHFSRWRHCIASNQVGHYVARYNIFDEYTQGFGDVDAHGAGYGNYGTGTRAIEIYNNTFMTPNPADSWTMAAVFHRGGGGVYFNNTINSGRGRFIYMTNDGTTWEPREDVEKYFTNDVYIWSNTIASGVSLTSKYDPEGLIIEGVNYHLSAPSFAYTPYPYPHPLTLEGSSTVKLSGRLLDKSGNPMDAKIIAIQQGIVKTSNNTINGYYSLSAPSGIYDIQFNFTSILNYYIRLNSVNLLSDRIDILNYINYSSQKISFMVDFEGSQGIETYSSSRPSRVLNNGTVMSDVSSLANLRNNSWFYESSKLHLIVIPEVISKLHVDGRWIKDESGKIMILKGANFGGYNNYQDGGWPFLGGGTMDANYQAMKDWEFNIVRYTVTASWWTDNLNNYRENIRNAIINASRYGIYVIFTPWRTNDTITSVHSPLETGWTAQQFSEWWANVAQDLKDLDNVIFELWNEPYDTPRSEWGEACQQAVNAIRATGDDHLIIYQWGFGCGPNCRLVNWFNEGPVEDPTGNLVLGTHTYGNGEGYLWQNQNNLDSMRSQMDTAQYDDVDNVLSMPLLMTESNGNTTETTFIDNALSIFDEWNLGYLAWTWRVNVMYTIREGSSFNPNNLGLIWRNHTLG